MRRKLLGIFIALVILVILGMMAVEVIIPVQKVINVDIVMGSVCHIGASGDYGSWQGSGVHLGNGLILTAGHVVKDADTFVITFENGQSSYASSTFYKEPTVDVGFIYLEDYDGPALNFDDDGYSRGDTTYIFGNPFGWDNRYSVTKGIVSGINRDCDGFFGGKLLLQVDSASWPGNSGGPVTDNEGEIIGILVGGYGGSECLSYCVPATICRQAMKTYLSILEMSRMQ